MKRSIGSRIGLALLLGGVILVAVLSASYVSTQRSETVAAEVHAARNLILMTESVREGMEEKWALGLFSPAMLMEIYRDTSLTRGEKKRRILAAVPVVSAWEAAKAKAKEGGFEFRTPRHNPRNRANVPDEIEAEALAYFAATPSAVEYHVIDENLNAIRYFRPVRLGKACMACHGDPATSGALWDRDDGIDITGNVMDGKKVGDLHGAFEVIRPLDEADAALQTRLIQGIALVLIIVGGGVALSFWFFRRVLTEPIGEAVEQMRLVAGGDLSQSDMNAAMAARDDEIGVLISETGSMRSHLRTTVASIRKAANNVANAAAEISSASEDLSMRTQMQAANLQEAASNLEQLSTTVRATASNAERTRTVTEESISMAQESSVVAKDALSAMDSIESAGQEMSEIIEVINDIAFQTNLLALNASVEAARAGEAGRGFAVVAEEIQKLAQRAANAASDVKGLIDNTGDHIKTGSHLVKETVVAFEGMVVSFHDVSDIITEVSEASQDQAAGIGEINSVIASVDHNINQDAAMVEEASASARSLEEQALALIEQVKFFRTNT